VAHRRGRRRCAIVVGRRKKNLEARARWEFGASGAVSGVKQRIDAVKARRGEKRQSQQRASAPPQLLPENILPWAVFRSCLTQLILGPAGGVVGISHASLEFKFRVYGVTADREAEVYEKFEFLETVFVAEINKGIASSKPIREPPRSPRRGSEGSSTSLVNR
jgi:Phage related hypothetical protein (DUF1799)